VLEQFKSAMDKLIEKNLAQYVQRVQLYMRPWATFKVVTVQKTGEVLKFTMKDGYLLKNGKPVTLPGKPNLFVRIEEL